MTRLAEPGTAPGDVLPAPRTPEPGRRSALSHVRDAIFRYGLLILLAALIVAFAVSAPSQAIDGASERPE